MILETIKAKALPYVGAIIGVLILLVGFLFWQLLGAHEDNGLLQGKIDSYKEKVTQLEEQMEINKKQAQQDMAAANASIRGYLESESNYAGRIKSLSSELKRAKENDDEIQECMSVIMPQSYIERLP